MNFIDLFAGLGGFHLALKELNHTCVFASEINKNLADLYEHNYGIQVAGDIKKINPESIPSHDILCAGFPCQPFSKAGFQNGLNDKNNGSLFYEIAKILEYHKPQYFILENVPHLKKHDNEKTWNKMVKHLQDKLGYYIDHKILSPHQFKIPHHRKRIFIVGSLNSLEHFNWPKTNNQNTDIREFLEKPPVKPRKLSTKQLDCLNVWQDFINSIPKTESIPFFPIWTMEFGATYPFENTTPYSMTSKQLSKYKGKYGISLINSSEDEQLNLLPRYARVQEKEFPYWKKRFIRLNREFYLKNKQNIQKAVKKIKKFDVESWKKLEWNCQSVDRNIMNYIIQFRASGIRVKHSNSIPSLVCPLTQIPIIGWEKRYITEKEGARLQSIQGIKLPNLRGVCFNALGNAVNVEIVKLIAKELIKD